MNDATSFTDPNAAVDFLAKNKARAISLYKSDTVRVTTYELSDGSKWVERASRLEPPYDDYSLTKKAS